MRTFGLLWLSALTFVAIGLTGVNFSQLVPTPLWWHSVWSPDGQDANQMLFHFRLLPRTVLSLLVGSSLGLVGVLFQQILRNPLAEPATLSVSAGAQLGLALATLWALPGGETTRQLATIVGAVAAGAIVFGVVSGRRMSPITLILAGLVVGLYCGAVKSLLTLFNHERLQSLFLWGSGMLNQYDWGAVSFLWPRMLIGLVIMLLMIRPLAMLALDDAVIRSLWVNLTVARIAGLGIAMVLSAMLVSVAGVIGFIGLFAPLLARMLGARRLGPQLALAMLAVAGALMQKLTGNPMASPEVLGVTSGAAFGVVLLLLLVPWDVPSWRCWSAVPVRAAHCC